MRGILFNRPIVFIVICYIAGILVCRFVSDRLCTPDPEFIVLPDRLEAVGTIAGDPEPRTDDGGRNRIWMFPFKIEKFKGGDGVWNTTGFTIRTSLLGFSWEDAPEYGERWKIHGHVKRYSNRAGVAVQVLEITRSGSELTGLADGGFLLRMCYRGRKRAAEILSLGIESHKEETMVLKALLLGYRAGFGGEMKKIFSDTGTLHIFAISGLNVGIIACLIAWVLGCCGISRVYWVLYVAPMLILFTVATGGMASAVRACIMAVVFYLGPLLGRKSDIIASLAFSALLILLFAPGQLSDLGFIYSFTVMIGLILLAPVFDEILMRGLKPDPLRIQPESGMKRALRCSVRFVAGLITVSVSAWLVSTPLTLYFFGQLVLISLVSNIVVVPMSFLIVVTGGISLVAGSCSDLLAIVFNNLNLIQIRLMIKAMKTLASIPGGNIELAEPITLGVLIVWYIILMLIWLLLRRAAKSRPEIH